MSYHGYLPVIKQYLAKLPHPPSILEVGVDRGVTFTTLAYFLARSREQFLATGVDVLVQDQVKIMLVNMDLQEKQQVYVVEGNSLQVMPNMISQGMKFDVLLLDGDHNYHTVSKEMEYVDKLVYDHSIVIIDDYNGRWSDKDLWYSERPGYEGVGVTTQRVDTEKHGVKPAVDEWLAAHPEWHKVNPLGGEPILLTKQNI
jgi:predicted O-methyltransferase YrrM